MLGVVCSVVVRLEAPEIEMTEPQSVRSSLGLRNRLLNKPKNGQKNFKFSTLLEF